MSFRIHPSPYSETFETGLPRRDETDTSLKKPGIYFENVSVTASTLALLRLFPRAPLNPT